MSALIALVVLMVCGFVGGIAAWISWLERHTRQLEIQVARADRQTQKAEEQHRLAEERRRLSDRHHYAESLRRAHQALDAHRIELAQDILHDIQPEPDGFDPRGFAWSYLWRLTHREFSQLWGHESTVTSVMVSRNGEVLATSDIQGAILLWDNRPGMAPEKRGRMPMRWHKNDYIFNLSQNGRYFAIAQA